MSEQEQIKPLSPKIETSVHHTDPASIAPSPPIPANTIPTTDQASPTPAPLTLRHARLTSDSALDTASDAWFEDTNSLGHSRPATMSLFSTKPSPPDLSLSNNVAQGASFDANTIRNIDKPLPKSPGTSKLGSFFGWGGNASPSSSSHTAFSEDKDYSPLPSPTSPDKHYSKSTTSRTIPTGIDVPKANSANESHFNEEFASPTASTPAHVGEMEEELRAISAELATSIRREMDLEDLVERLQVEAENPRGPNKRTSDYFSDSGTSSVKYGGDVDARSDEMDRLQRKTEREKAQLRLDCQEKVQDERTRRKVLEKQIRHLEEKVSEVDLVSINSLDKGGRLKDLETTCEDLRRRLNEEKQVKENFEDLLTALKGELHVSHNERDNLRDEIVPQLRARVEGLEAQAVEHEKLTYENTKMQQQMQGLEAQEAEREKLTHENMRMQQQMQDLETQAAQHKKLTYENTRMQQQMQDLEAQAAEHEKLTYENTRMQQQMQGLESQAAEHEKLTSENTKMQQQMQALKIENATFSTRKLQTDMQQHMDSIGEESPQPNSGLKRSTSVTHSVHSITPLRSRPTSMSLTKGVESRDMLIERVKDIEAQRDALHRALKSLLERQEHQNRENDKKLRQLEMERDRALSNAPKRIGYDQEVTNLRDEINRLRRRADEAIEQKWQCEKGLGGLKMDLDRAEQEIGSLRCLLQDNTSEGHRGSSSANSESLVLAYGELRKTYATSLERVKTLESQMPKDENTERALAELEQSLSDAISERDFARQEAEAYRLSVESLQGNEKRQLNTEIALADELRSSAKRVEELAAQVRHQLDSNATLRDRLAETIEFGEREQKSNAARIMRMQGKLRTLEEALMAAQQASEDRITTHEEDIRDLKESGNSQLVRVKEALKSPRFFGSKSPLTPLFSGSNSPRLDATTSGKAMTFEQETQMKALKRRVEELERALEEADGEMEEVVGRMNVAQIEVMELQNEREESVRLTNQLQARIEAEKMRGFEGRFKTLQS